MVNGNQYLTERGQGTSAGQTTTYSADGATLNLTGTTFSANTAVMATRSGPGGQAGSDTTCRVNSGSASTYKGAAQGDPITVYMDGMRLLVEVDTTSAGSAITLDCGNGPRNVYQNDGLSVPTAAQWASGAQVLVSYDQLLNSGAGGWRILSGGATSGSSAPATATVSWHPWTGGFSGNPIQPFGAANEVRHYMTVVPYPGAVVNTITLLSQGEAGHAAAALYSGDCNHLLATSQTVAAGNAPEAVDFTFGSYPLPPGPVDIAFTVDNTGFRFYADAGDNWLGYLSNAGLNPSTYNVFVGGNSSTGTATLSFPSTCGSRTPLNLPNNFYIPAMTIK